MRLQIAAFDHAEGMMIAGFIQALKCRRLWFGRSAALFLTLVAGFALSDPAESARRPQETGLTESQQLTLQKITGAAREKRGSKRATGISVLFACAESKEKTAAAQMLAKELGRDLYRVDLSRVVSSTLARRKRICGEFLRRPRKIIR